MLRFPAAFLLLLSVTTALSGQAASYTVTGTGCTTGRISAQLGPVPLAARGLPRIGGAFEVLTEPSARYPWGNTRVVYLLTGASGTSVGGVPLPFDISTLKPGQPYCGFLGTSGEISIRLPTLTDYVTPTALQFAIPNAAALLGVILWQQAVSMESSSFGPPFASMALSPVGICVLGL